MYNPGPGQAKKHKFCPVLKFSFFGICFLIFPETICGQNVKLSRTDVFTLLHLFRNNGDLGNIFCHFGHLNPYWKSRKKECSIYPGLIVAVRQSSRTPFSKKQNSSF